MEEKNLQITVTLDGEEVYRNFYYDPEKRDDSTFYGDQVVDMLDTLEGIEKDV